MEMHDDMNQDKDMIKEILQKIIDEMGSMEADRIMPENRKPKMAMKVESVSAPVDSMDDEELDPNVLGELMDKAGQADESGELPEDKQSDLPPEIVEAIRRKQQSQ